MEELLYYTKGTNGHKDSAAPANLPWIDMRPHYDMIPDDWSGQTWTDTPGYSPNAAYHPGAVAMGFPAYVSTPEAPKIEAAPTRDLQMRKYVQEPLTPGMRKLSLADLMGKLNTLHESGQISDNQYYKYLHSFQTSLPSRNM